MALDLSGRTDDEVQIAYNTLVRNPERFADNLEYRIALRAEYDKRFGARKRPAPPSNVDANLDAAASPVTPDPALRPAPQAPAADDPRAAYEARMVAAGFTPDEAKIAADYESRQAGAFNPAFSSDETLRAGAAYMRRQDADEAALERRLDVAYGPRPARAPAAARRPEGRVPSDPEDYRMGGAGTRGVVGPRTDDGRPARLAPEFADSEEAAEYYVRPRDPKTGQLMPSRADEAMMARGFVPVYTPDGNVSYSLATDYDGPNGIADKMSPHALRNAGTYVGHNIVTAGERHQNVRVGADGRPIYDPATGLPQKASWEAVSVKTPFGDRSVLRLTDEARQSQAAQRQRDAAIRVGKRIGQDPNTLLDPKARGDALRADYEDDQRARREFLRNRNTLAGGSQNVNGDNRAMYNQLAMMSPEEQIRQLQYALPGGELRAQVDARQLDTAARLAQGAVTGALAGTAAGPLAEKQADALELANDAKRAEQRAVIENDLAEQYAATGWFGYDDFTLEEQQQMIDTLVNVHNYTLAEAQAAVDRIASKRRATQRMPRPGSATPAGG